MRLLSGTLALVLLFTIPIGADKRPPAQKKQAEIGMSEAELVDALGRPQRVARQILFRRHVEQWTYDSRQVRVELDCVRGKPARVTSVRSLRLQKD
jgi:hypothetical protein